MFSCTQVSLPQAVQMATYNPARLIGAEGVTGRLEEGYDADIVVLDQNWNVMMTIVRGDIIYRR